MKKLRFLVRSVLSVLIRDLVPYGLASIAAALTVVTCTYLAETAQGRSLGLNNLVIAVVYACVATGLLALPAAALLIALGEWKKFGVLYHVAAGFLAGTLSWLLLFTEVFFRIREGDGSSYLRSEDLVTLLSVGLGGAIGGYVFIRTRILLVSRLGELAFHPPKPEI